MAVTGVEKDFDTLTLRLTAEFDAPVEAVWELWANPRKLEQWWGPPGWPATFVDHNLTPGGAVSYYMTGPDGTKAGGWWRVETVNPPTSITYSDGFADTEGNPVDSLPSTQSEMILTNTDGKTVMTLSSRYETLEALQTVLEMGMEEGITLAVNQMDALL